QHWDAGHVPAWRQVGGHSLWLVPPPRLSPLPTHAPRPLPYSTAAIPTNTPTQTNTPPRPRCLNLGSPIPARARPQTIRSTAPNISHASRFTIRDGARTP